MYIPRLQETSGCFASPEVCDITKTNVYQTRIRCSVHDADLSGIRRLSSGIVDTGTGATAPMFAIPLPNATSPPKIRGQINRRTAATIMETTPETYMAMQRFPLKNASQFGSFVFLESVVACRTDHTGNDTDKRV